eukprot:CAMPEP_0174833964 /NCGR_PEP_ID=MMETSP1114-20130205/4553_1 /TAXON_ID=312471 /ORGANISM="Neobodo designis, Strain CCAP 1951/1" /LENGTH=409 /DNA_ID=CAMNT_0016067867 /DNA_START=85 /DNA_END=1314 /DNA_ORIENTATION=+
MASPQPFFYVGHGTVARSPPPRLKPIRANTKRRSASTSASPACHGDSPGPAPPADPTERIAAAVNETWRRLQPNVAPSGQHQPAHFMAEITSYVETQLQRIARQYPHYLDGAAPTTQLRGKQPPPPKRRLNMSPLDQASHTSNEHDLAAVEDVNPATGLTLLQEEALRVKGAAALSDEERARKARLQVFIEAQRMFAESFQTYKLFLDALTDEHVSYDRFVEDTTTRYKEVIAGLNQKLLSERAAHVAKMTALETAIASERETFAAERGKLQRQRQQLLEAAKEKKGDNDSRRYIQELEQSWRQARETISKLTDENDTLTRQNNALSIGTFSDALDQANQQLAELRQLSARKDEQLIEAHDEVAALTRDIKKLLQHHNSRVEEPLKPDDLRLSAVTMRVLFPEERKYRL